MTTEEDEAAKFAIALQATAKAFYQRELSTETLLWYYDDLKYYGIDAVAAALQRHRTTPDKCRFFPIPGDLIALMEESTYELATSAWRSVDQAVREHGRYASVTFDDPAIAPIVAAMGGWVEMCSASNDREMESRRVEFVKRYESSAKRAGSVKRGQVGTRLPGLLELARPSQLMGERVGLLGSDRLRQNALVEGDQE